MDDTVLTLAGERLYSAKGISKILGCSESKVRRLMTSGATAIDGRLIHLQSMLTEGGRKTSVEAYRRFQIDLNRRKDNGSE